MPDDYTQYGTAFADTYELLEEVFKQLMSPADLNYASQPRRSIMANISGVPLKHTETHECYINDLINSYADFGTPAPPEED